jgi:hypothetical protein
MTKQTLTQNEMSNISHNLPKDYYEVSYEEKKNIISNNLFLSWLNNKISN